VETASEVHAAVHRAKESDGLALIEVLTDPADRNPDLAEFVRILTSRTS
jgi:thiamine pyrophosphate-dependent acetolactate synthase large subunit-like protein